MKMKATVKILTITLLLLAGFSFERPAKAASEDACAIWLCLPGGFPQGCSGAYKEFKHRLKKRRPPLPDLSSCTTGPNGETSDGKYEVGYEKYYPCDEGYKLDARYESEGKARCMSESYYPFCMHKEGMEIAYIGEEQCSYYYLAKRRPKPSYVKMWVGGEYLGQYFF